MGSEAAPTNAAAAPGAPKQRGRGRRRLGAAVRMMAALLFAGGLYTVLAPGAQATDPVYTESQAAQGKALYDVSCISCHGTNAQGVEDRGPSLIGVGGAAVEFQVGTGRMPMARQEAQADRKPAKFNDEETKALAAYIQSLGGGPTLPEGTDYAQHGNIAEGGELFRINCASCHAYSGGGGALSSGKYAPSLQAATDRDIYAAMLSGPQNMPVFGDNQLTPEQKFSIIAYVQNMETDTDPGGWGLGRFGPVTEGLAIFLVGMVALLFAALWIAGKS